MANIIYGTMIVNGSKDAIVKLLNKALKNDKSSKRLSVQMTGKRIAYLTYCLSESSFIPCPKTFDNWDTTNPVFGFFRWYKNGCKNKMSPRGKKASITLGEKRYAEVNDYMLAHPEVFKPLPTERYDKRFESIGIELGMTESHIPSKPRFSSESFDHALELMHPKLIPAYRRYVRGYYRAGKYQQDKYGATGWRDWSTQNYGCKWATFGGWKCLRDENGELCLSAHVQSPWSPPHKLFDYISGQDGISVYAHGYDLCEWGYTYNGTARELTIIDPYKESCRETYLQELAKENGIELTEEARRGGVPGFDPWEVDDRIIYERLKGFENEVFTMLGFKENPIEKFAKKSKNTTPDSNELPF